MKKSLLIALLAFAGIANATPPVATPSVGNGNANGFSGTFTGSGSANVTSNSTGSAITATLVQGNGLSTQSADNITTGLSTAGGTIGQNSISVNTMTNDTSLSHASGTISGGAVAMQGTSTVNGGAAFGSSDGVAHAIGSLTFAGTGTFGSLTIGGND